MRIERFVVVLLACTLLAPLAAADDENELPELGKIMRELHAIRGLPFTKDVPGRKQDADDFAAFVSTEIDVMFPEDMRDGMQAGLLRLGMLAKPIDLGGEFEHALVSQAGGYYDPETDTFYYLVEDMPREMMDTIAAHELVHALQDQHFDLLELIGPLEKPGDGPRNDDALLALRCLVEGEATYVQTIWQMKSMMGMDLTANPAAERMTFRMMADMDLDQLVQLMEQNAAMFEGGIDDELAGIAEAMEAMDSIPPYILEPLNAAYMSGAYFTMCLRQDGGWERVDRAYADLPASAEQALHPERYLGERDDPSTFEFPMLAGVALAAGGWERIDAAIHGEFYLDLLLRRNGCDSAIAKAAADGWDGDLYAAYRDDRGRVLIVLATTWDSDEDAAEFLSAYRTALASKYPGLADVRESDDGRRVAFDCGDEALGAGVVRRRGREVFAVEGGSAAEADMILRAIEGSTIHRR